MQKDNCQDTTDLEKCLKHLTGFTGKIIVYGAFGGRIDQTLSSIHVLFKNPQLDIMLVDKYSIMTLINVGKTIVRPSIHEERKGCGLIPVDGKVDQVKTEGLKWNLELGQEMSMGGLISTSNEIIADEVHIETDKPLVWSTSLKI
jgi:thiamine pyrophosphokinase